MNYVFLMDIIQRYEHLHEEFPDSKFGDVHGTTHSFDISAHIASIAVFHDEVEHLTLHK